MQSPLSPAYPYDLNSPYSAASYQTDPSPVSDPPTDDDYLYASTQIAIYNTDLPHPYDFDPAMWPDAKKQHPHVYHVPRSQPAYPPQYHPDLKAAAIYVPPPRQQPIHSPVPSHPLQQQQHMPPQPLYDAPDEWHHHHQPAHYPAHSLAPFSAAPEPAAPPNQSSAPPRIKQEDLAAFPASIPAYPAPPSQQHIPMSHQHQQHLLQSHAHDTQNPQAATGSAASPFALLSPLQQPQPAAYYSPPFRPQQQQPQQYQQQVYASTGTVHPADVSPQSDASVSPLSTYADLSGAVAACDPRFVCPPQAQAAQAQAQAQQQQQSHPHPHQQNGFHPVGGLDSDMGMGEMDLDGHMAIVSGGMGVGMAPHVMEDVGMVVVGGMGEEDADGEEDWGDHVQMQVQQGYEQHHQQQTEYMDDGEHEQGSHSRTSTSTSASTSTTSTSTTTSRGRILRRPISKSLQHQPGQDQDNHTASPSEEDEFDDESESDESEDDDDDDEFVLKPRSRTRGGMGVGSSRRRGSAVPVSASAMAAAAQAQLQAQAAQAHAGHGQGQGQGMPSSYPTTTTSFGGYSEGRTLRPRSVSRYTPYAEGAAFGYDEQSMFSSGAEAAAYDGRRRYNSHPGASASPALSTSTSSSLSHPSRSTSSASNHRTSSTPSSSSSTASASTHTTTTSTARRRLRPSPTMPIPVPVPNLTKKSRGRRVPTMSSLEDMRSAASGAGKKRQSAAAGGKNARMYLCDVEGCGKCFARGEHLKRHVRSIHTYEKPHRCPYPGCGKDFSRHDNLGQHMRVHKDFVPPASLAPSVLAAQRKKVAV